MVDLLDFFLRKLLIIGWILRKDFVPDIDHGHCEGQGELHQVDGGAELEEAEVFEVEVPSGDFGLVLLGSVLLLDFLCLLLFWLFQVELEDVVDDLLLVNHLGLLLLHEGVLRVFGQHFASGCSELSHYNFRRHYLVDQIPERHFNDFDASKDM